ncbi:hypothetical protein COLO4_06396 [Corchorus olitorius]|uniref:Malectin-like domain-containing protein n=1 Tax=Corchorus olitorius TaxID=93759 RepID=A0A1R3KN83_9ROSI|nr:hypothetical protein COLO4_06396 [Corchorus olitorius]
MEALEYFLPVLIVSFYSAILVHTQDQSDAPYIQTGTSNMILPEYRSLQQRQMWSLRSFPDGVRRNCYNIKLRKGDKYIIAAYFMYGNYDNKNELPKFDLHLGPNVWDTVTITNWDSFHFIDRVTAFEKFNLPNSNRIKLALFGRYKEDAYDRAWWPYLKTDWMQINTSLSIDFRYNDYQPPVRAMRTVGTPINASRSMDFTINAAADAQLYVYMHFAEIEKLQANESRVFNISYNGKYWFGPYTPVYLLADTIYSTSPLTAGTDHDFSIYRTQGSTHPPILNAIEIHLVQNFSQSETVQKDGIYASSYPSTNV